MLRNCLKFLESKEFNIFEPLADLHAKKVKCKLCLKILNIKHKGGSTTLKLHLKDCKKRSSFNEEFYNEKTCRVCLKTATEGQQFNLIMENLAEKFKQFSGIDVQESKSITNSICKECWCRLESCESFYLQCQESERILCEMKMKASEIKIEDEMSDNDASNFDDTDANEVLLGETDTQNESEMLIAEISSSSREGKFKRKQDGNGRVLKKNLKSKQKSSMSMCDICGNCFKSARLYSHLRRHNNIKPHICEICSKAFTTSSELCRHMRVHTGERPFACKYCERRFTDKSTHTKHERTHTGERPFSCDKCGKSFTYSEGIRKHMVVHTGEKNYACVPCNKAFSRPHLLKQHENTQIHKKYVKDSNQI